MVPNRDDTPPEPGPEIEIVRLKALQTVSCVAVGLKVRGFRTHWHAKLKQTIPCFKPVEECEGHRLQLPQRWKGYLHVLMNYRTAEAKLAHKEAFLELTPVAAMDLRVGLGHNRDLRGIPFTLTRLNGNKAHLKVAVFLDNCIPEQKLPEPKSPYQSLMRLWGYLDYPPEDDQRDMFD